MYPAARLAVVPTAGGASRLPTAGRRIARLGIAPPDGWPTPTNVSREKMPERRLDRASPDGWPRSQPPGNQRAPVAQAGARQIVKEQLGRLTSKTRPAAD